MDRDIIISKMKRSLEVENREIEELLPNDIDGMIIKKIREERGISLKDAAGSLMSVRTLRRFEEGETSISLKLFMCLISKLRIHYMDFILEKLTAGKGPSTAAQHNGDLMIKAIKYMSEGNYSAMISTFAKELKNEDIPMMRRYIIASFTGKYAKNLKLPFVVKENSLVVFEYLQSTNKRTISEKSVLNSVIDICGVDDIPLEFIYKLLADNKDFYENGDYLFAKMMIDSLNANLSCCNFLIRCGRVEEAEKYCDEALEKIKKGSGSSDYIHKIILNFNLLSAQIKLRLNKVEGVELANKCIRQLDSMIELSNFAELKKLREESTQLFYELNQTEEDFEF